MTCSWTWHGYPNKIHLTIFDLRFDMSLFHGFWRLLVQSYASTHKIFQTLENSCNIKNIILAPKEEKNKMFQTMTPIQTFLFFKFNWHQHKCNHIHLTMNTPSTKVHHQFLLILLHTLPYFLQATKRLISPSTPYCVAS